MSSSTWPALAAALLLAGSAVAQTPPASEPGPSMPMSVWLTGYDASGREIMKLGAPRLMTGRYDSPLMIEMELGSDLNALFGAVLKVKAGSGPPPPDSWTHFVITAPSGQTWRRARTAPRDAGGMLGSGFPLHDDPALPGLADALLAGGKFTVALEDTTGRLWDEMVLDTALRPERERLWNETQAEFAASKPSDFAFPIPRSAPARR